MLNSFFERRKCFKLSNPITLDDNRLNHLRADCEKCFGLCCVALPYAKSADFAFDKDGGTPCRNLQSNYLCGIHENLITTGFKGCVGYECFGAGQRVSQMIYEGNDWRDNKTRAKEMFEVFPIVQQLHEMLWYLSEALQFQATNSIHNDLRISFEETERLIRQTRENILKI